MLPRPNLLFAFVDLRTGSNKKPDVFIVPSKTVFEAFDNLYFKYGKRRRWRWHACIKDIEKFKTIGRYLARSYTRRPESLEGEA
jgi:hypothetical protein